MTRYILKIYKFLLIVNVYLEKTSAVIIFLFIYSLVLCPMAVIMRIFGYNAMRYPLQNESFFVERNHSFKFKDLENPF